MRYRVTVTVDHGSMALLIRALIQALKDTEAEDVSLLVERIDTPDG